MARSSLLWMGLALALGLVASPVLANGRFPRAQQLIEDPNDPNHLILRSTYGVLVTKNGGESWHWICERAVGYGGVEDPSLGLTATGRILAGVFDGLSSSPDQGCSWSFVPGPMEGRYVVDLSVERGDGMRAVAMVSMGQTADGSTTFLNQLHRTTDGGETWSPLGPALSGDLLLRTLDPAPSDPTRIYVSGIEFASDGQGGPGVLLRSDDDAQSFTKTTIPGTSLEYAPFIATVDPNDPDRLYVRAAGADQDFLLVSHDGGQSFQELIRGEAELYGFALSPDGATVLAGFGDPRDGTAIDETKLGIWSASTSDFVFEKIYDKPVACLTWTTNALYACTGQFDAGFELGKSNDGGKTFSSLMALADLQGPLECPAGTGVGDLCPTDWPSTCESIGKCTTGTDGGAGSDAGASGGSGGGDPDPPADDGGCGCRAPSSGGEMSAVLALALAALVAGRAFRRRSR